MFRSKIKGLARKIAVKALNMEFDVEERKEQDKSTQEYDPSFIPKVVDGSGDTPGPNHKQDIGRTWLSAQIVGGVSPCIIDIRPPNEVIAGMLPGAILMTADALKQNLNHLPNDKNTRVTIYDQTGELGSVEMAEWVRDQGWTMARRLKGGYAEWLEHDEQIAPPQDHPKAKIKIGDPVTVGTIHGFVHRSLEKDGKLIYEIWTSQEGIIGSYPEEELKV